MGQRILAALLLVLGLMVLIAPRSRRGQAGPHVPNAAEMASGQAAPQRQVALQPNPAANAPPQSTPEVDLLAILTVRRRIAREGSRVYLDALLNQTDSIVVRWADRSSREFLVAFIPDTTLKGWTDAALAAAESGLQQWSGNSAGISLSTTADTAAADILVRWTPYPGGSHEIGATQTTWGQDGIITHATITLALALNDSTEISTADRNRAAAHEFGHALGLPHSPHTDDLMFARSEQDAPSQRDQATLLLLYTVPPGTLKTGMAETPEMPNPGPARGGGK